MGSVTLFFFSEMFMFQLHLRVATVAEVYVRATSGSVYRNVNVEVFLKRFTIFTFQVTYLELLYKIWR